MKVYMLKETHIAGDYYFETIEIYSTHRKAAIEFNRIVNKLNENYIEGVEKVKSINDFVLYEPGHYNENRIVISIIEREVL